MTQRAIRENRISQIRAGRACKHKSNICIQHRLLHTVSMHNLIPKSRSGIVRCQPSVCWCPPGDRCRVADLGLHVHWVTRSRWNSFRGCTRKRRFGWGRFLHRRVFVSYRWSWCNTICTAGRIWILVHFSYGKKNHREIENWMLSLFHVAPFVDIPYLALQ